MRIAHVAAAGAACVALIACGGKGDDRLGEQAQEEMRNRADATREAGEAKRQALDEADVDADAMSNAEKDAVVHGD